MKYLLLLMALSGCNKLDTNCHYTGNMSHWASHSETFYMDSSVPEDAKPAIMAAAEVWNSAAGYSLIVVQDEVNTGNVISFAPGPDPIREATTRTVTSLLGYIGQADIIVNTNGIGNVDMESLLIHEMGHSLGFSHDTQGVMFPILPEFTVRRTLTDQDIKNLRCEY